MELDKSVTKGCERILEVAGKYNILHKYERGGKRAKIQKVMTISVLEDLTHRQLRYPFDLLAIAGNACGYDIRVDTENDKISEFSLSLLLLELCARNGDIMNNNKQASGNLHKGVVKYLEDKP